MSISKLHIFSKNTDALAATRGYEYQKLKTLETWLSNNIERVDENIFCDYEEDIFQQDLKKYTSKFRQLKLYSSNFSFSSEEIHKSICHFFMLYVKGDYLFDDVQFTFEANSAIARKVQNNDADLLKAWHEHQDALPQELLDRIKDKVKDIITNYINQEYIRLSANLNIKQNIEEAKNVLFNLNTSQWYDFLLKIKWKFDNKSAEESIKNVIEQIEKSVERLPYPIEKRNIPTTVSRLYYEVAQKSIGGVPEERILNNALLENILLSIGDDDDRWYGEIYEKWKNVKSISNFYFGQFYEVINATNHCRWRNYLSSHDNLWIRLLEGYIKIQEVALYLKKRAIYESLWLQLRPDADSFRPLGTLHGSEEKIRFYFNDLTKLDSVEEFEYAANLLGIVKGSFVYGIVSISKEELDSWLANLYQGLIEKNNITKNLNNKCSFLELIGEFELSLRFGVLNKEKCKIAMHFFEEIIPLLDKAPLYPITHLSNRINATINLLIQIDTRDSNVIIDELESFSNKILPFVLKRESNFKIAKVNIDLGYTYLKKREPKYILKALEYFHKAKESYLSEESLEGHVLALMNISQFYAAISMNLAAKYYALGALWICISADKPNLYKRIHEAYAFLIHSDFKQGAFISVIYDLHGFIKGRSEFSTKEWDFEKDELLKNTFLDVAFVLFSIPKLSPDLSSYITFIKEKLGWAYTDFYLKDWVDSLSKDIDSEQKLIEFLENRLDDLPLNDIGSKRTISWQALGCLWEINFINDASLNAMGEEYCAILQIIQAELALDNSELFLLSSSINIELTKSKNFMPPVQLPSNNKYHWKVEIQELTGSSEVEVNILFQNIGASLLFILNDISLLPGKKFINIFENLIRSKDLAKKTFVSQSYQRIYKKFFTKNVFNESKRDKYNQPNQKFKLPKQNRIVLGNEGLSSTYNKSESLERIALRYSNSYNKVESVLNNWIPNSNFQNIIKDLRNEGWLDWQILMAISNFLGSAKASQLTSQIKFISEHEQINYFRKTFDNIMKQAGEIGYNQVPVNSLTSLDFKIQIQQSPILILNSWSLEYKSNYPNFSAVKEFLNQHFNFDKDDVPEANPLFKII